MRVVAIAACLMLLTLSPASASEALANEMPLKNEALGGEALSSESAATTSEPATTSSVTLLSKVTSMLQEMKAKSEVLSQEADTAHAGVTTACQEQEIATDSQVAALSLEVENLQAEVSQSAVDLAQMRSDYLTHQFEFGNSTFELEQIQNERSTQAAAFTRDLTEYDAAISAVDRALEMLAQQEASSTSSGEMMPTKLLFLGLKKVSGAVEAAVADAYAAAKKLRQAYQPDVGGIAKDEHLFDDFDGLSTASSHYISQSGDITTLLTDLKTTFTSERSGLLSAEEFASSSFESEESLLQQQIENLRTSINDDKGNIAAKEISHADTEEQLAKTTANHVAAQAYLVKLKEACQEKEDAYVAIKAMRISEINALEAAIELLQGNVAAHSTKHFPALLRMRMRHSNRSFVARGDNNTGRILGFLKTKARVLKSGQLGKLSNQVAELIGEASDSKTGDDPLAKVKTMIQDLVITLQNSAAEEATHSAWCETEIAKNEKEQADAATDVKTHNSTILSHETAIAKLALEVQELNEALAAAVPQRASMVSDRSDESAVNTLSVQESEESVAALENAIQLLQEFYAGQSTALGLLQKKAPWRRVPATKLVADKSSGSSVLKLVRVDGTPIDETIAATTAAPGSAYELPDAVSGGVVASAPQTEAAGGIIAMLEVAASDFKKLKEETEQKEAEAATLNTNVLAEHDVMVVEAEKDRDFKMSEELRLSGELAESKLDLTSSSAALSDAETAYEQLKPPCLNVETYEERKAKRDAEISGLTESLDMLDTYATASGSISTESMGGLLQQGDRRKLNQTANKEMPLKGTEATTTTVTTAAVTAPDPAQIEMIASLLQSVREEVAADLVDDENVYKEMVAWCTDTEASKQSAIADAQTRENELITEIETSASEKATLEVQITNLEEDITTEEKSLEQAAALRGKAQDSFRDSEKELTESITALKNALIVLEQHFDGDKAEVEDLAADRAEIEAFKDTTTAAPESAETMSGEMSGEMGGETLSLAVANPARITLHNQATNQNDAQLMTVAVDVQRTMAAMPGAEAALAALAPQDAATFRTFLASPGEVMSRPEESVGFGLHRRASLVVQRSVDGQTIFGILSQLLETFQADLEDAQAKESADKETHVGLASSKSDQIAAVQVSLSSKREQLAYYTTVNANAKEDMAFNSAARQADSAYLANVQTQCRESDAEFDVRNTTRYNEVAALDEAISILGGGIASEPVASALSDQPMSGDMMSGFLLHRHAGKLGTGRTFRRSNSSAHLLGSYANATAAIVKASRAAASSTTNSSNFSQPADHGMKLKVLPEKVLAAAAERMQAARKALSTLATGAQVQLRKRQSDNKALAALGVKFQTDLRRTMVGPLTKESLATVVAKIETLRTTLLTQKKLEITMHTTCVSEKNSATEQLERRISDDERHNNTHTRLVAQISNIELEVEELNSQIQAIESALSVREEDRKKEYAAYGESVKLQEAHQKTLLEAMQALKNFYAANPSMGTLLEVRTKREITRTIRSQRASPANASQTVAQVTANETLPRSVAKPEKRSVLLLRHQGMPVKEIPGAAEAEPAATEAAPNLPERDINRVDTEQYKVTEEKKSFSKPMQTHAGSLGIIGILELLVDQSEELTKELIKAETTARDGLILSTNDAKASVEAKEREIVTLQETMGVAESEKLEAETEIASAQQEMTDINAFLQIVENKCAYLVTNFADNQEARTTELDNLETAKHTIEGMAA